MEPNGPWRAVVLRTTPWREADLLVELYTREAGRLTLAARGARRSYRRFGGALEPGTRLDVHATAGRGGPSLGDCDVRRGLVHIRADLDRIHHAAYGLEVVRVATPERAPDPGLYDLLEGHLDRLEEAPATAEGLALWQLAALAHLGHGLRPWPCVRTGAPADGLSLALGGGVCRRRVATPDAVPAPPAGLAALALLAAGQAAPLPEADATLVALAGVWRALTGRPLRTARFLAGLEPGPGLDG